MRKARGTPPPQPPSTKGRGARVGAIASMVPLAVSLIPTATSVVKNARQPAAPAAVAARPRTTAPKEFSIPVSNLRQWASTVVVRIPEVKIEGHSKVHRQEADCELHFGAHSPAYRGLPPGLVLEPMNVCTAPFQDAEEQKDSDWINFANKINNTVVTVAGVPRIWPEHLTGGGEPSNPNHAVEIHPLTAIESNGETFDFSANVSAGEYRGGVGEPTAESIVKQTAVTVAANGELADINFFGGRIGNFTTLEINVEKATIASDGAGSFRMNGQVVLSDGTTVPVRMVTAKGSPLNDQMESLKRRRAAMVNLGQVLVLFSLSPQALLDAVSQSNGTPMEVVMPLQLILFGAPEEAG
jgi:hypothetical protein